MVRGRGPWTRPWRVFWSCSGLLAHYAAERGQQSHCLAHHNPARPENGTVSLSFPLPWIERGEGGEREERGRRGGEGEEGEGEEGEREGRGRRGEEGEGKKGEGGEGEVGEGGDRRGEDRIISQEISRDTF